MAVLSLMLLQSLLRFSFRLCMGRHYKSQWTICRRDIKKHLSWLQLFACIPILVFLKYSESFPSRLWTGFKQYNTENSPHIDNRGRNVFPRHKSEDIKELRLGRCVGQPCSYSLLTI